MGVQKRELSSEVIKLFIEEDGKEVARAYLYLISNDLHPKPYGLMEDVFVEESFRGRGYGTTIVNALIDEARQRCYKLIATSRYSRTNVHELYQRLGFNDWGKEFRIDFE